MAGNVGTQSLAVTIRVLMDEDVSPRQKLALVGKEARVGLMNGLLLGLLSFGAIGLYLMAAMGAAAAVAFSVSFCTGTALLVSRLHTQGRLSVTEEISELWGCRICNPHCPDAPITLGMLLSHTSSIVDSPAYFAAFQSNSPLSELLSDPRS